MAPKLDSMTNGGTTITRARWEDGGKLAEGFTTRVSKAVMPKGGGGGGDQGDEKCSG